MQSIPDSNNRNQTFTDRLHKLFYVGVDDGFDIIDSKRIVITNYTIALALFCCIIYSIVLTYINLVPLNYIFYFFTLYYPIVWRLNSLGKIVSAKLGVYFGLLIQVSLMSYVMADQVNIKTFYIPIAIIPFIVFGQKERKYLYFSILITFLNIVSIYYLSFPASKVQINTFDSNKYEWLYLSIDIACICCMVVLAFAFQYLTEFSENLLRGRNSELEVSKLEQQRLNELKGKLLSIISHDFKSPLNNFKNVAELIELGHLSQEEISSLMKGLGQTVRNTSQVLDNLLSWSAGKMDNFIPEINRVSIKELVGQVVHQLEYKLIEKNIIISQNINEEHYLMADRGMLEIILRNLLTNAIKFSYRGEKIEVSTMLKDSNLMIEVSDYGVGIPTEIFNKLFLPDYSKSRYGTAKEKGFGLGLILCKELIELHNGEISVSSILGEKTTFTLIFKVNVVEEIIK